MILRAAVLLVVVLLLFCAPVSAGETRTIELPRAGLSVDVPGDWTVVQYSPYVLELKSGPSIVWVEECEPTAEEQDARTWGERSEGGLRCEALVARDGLNVFEVEARVADAAGRAVVDTLLDSMDTTPYLYATRHVDWTAGWTLTLPEGWVRPREIAAPATFHLADHTAQLEVERLSDVLKAAGGEAATPEDLDGWTDFAWREGLKRIQEAGGVSAEDAPTIETLSANGLPARRVHLGLDLDDKGKPRAWMHMFVSDGFRVLAWSKRATEETDAELRDAVNSFQLGTHPGPRAGTAEPTDRFPGEKGPSIVFALPEGWKVTPGTNSMRLAQVEIAEDVEAVVFFFGAGGGGDLEANLDRWRGQMGNPDGGTVETHEPADGVKVTVLDVTGAYASSQMNPHGRDPHGGDDSGSEDSRMLGAIVEIAGGPLFIKVVGPEDTVDGVADAVTGWLLSIRPGN